MPVKGGKRYLPTQWWVTFDPQPPGGYVVGGTGNRLASRNHDIVLTIGAVV